MPLTAHPDRPRVFLSFAGDDRPKAVLLAEQLRARGVDSFVDALGIKLGEDYVLAINRALDESDYYVLLWSRHCDDRPFVDAEWTAAFCRELAGRRAFLFVVRLDDRVPPTLLSTRRYLDAEDDWAVVADQLTAAWKADSSVAATVLPVPVPSAVDGGGPSISLHVRNRALSVAHVLDVPAEATGEELHVLVRTALALPDEETRFGGAVGLRFFYQLKSGDDHIPDEPLARVGITDGATIDIEVRMESFGPDGSFARSTFRRGEATAATPAMVRTLVRSALGHLFPSPPRSRRPRLTPPTGSAG
ncbi:toll/interleukin-1 receptor domain-containing protein [Umezawaea endophytica]|uniref:Toll/interleukin-1 receptor domain-containing protein n=1 Tax=Umezawaea endophytica TaxID=1654476 RepID=A0A9X3A0G0_9PSEU|nr:toll/interleukin-1 receptor domain-containing protein [Umezawaea endophytica]MCS7478529.1 toll/interleukin-1 receptor domain-containing protein [Umezawaea endophytica]